MRSQAVVAGNSCFLREIPPTPAQRNELVPRMFTRVIRALPRINGSDYSKGAPNFACADYILGTTGTQFSEPEPFSVLILILEHELEQPRPSLLHNLRRVKRTTNKVG